MSNTRAFHLGDLLSVVTGRLVSPSHIGGVYEVCDFVTGEQHMTHQLPRACDAVTPWLLEQHPWLADIEVPDFDFPSGISQDDAKRIVGEWLATETRERGILHLVDAMPLGMYVGREPLTELREMAPHAQIIGIEVPRDGAS